MAATCARCGAALEPGGRFCGECGAAVVSAPPAPGPAAQPAPPAAAAAARKRGPLGVLLGVAVLVAVALLAPDSVVQQLPAPVAWVAELLRGWLPGGGTEPQAPTTSDEPAPPGPLTTLPEDGHGAATALDEGMTDEAQIFVEGEIGDFMESLNFAGANFLEAPPQLLHRVEPVYPEESLARGVTGTVLLLVFVDAEGTVVAASAVEGPDEVTQRAAEDAVQQWRYAPPGGDEPLVAFEVRVEFGGRR